MSFDYSEYSRVFLEIPLIFSIFPLSSILSFLFRSIAAIFRKKPISDVLNRQAFLSLLIAFFLLYQISSPFFHGGYQLFSEKEIEAISCKGGITEIRKTGKYETVIKIDQIEYIIIDSGNFEVGNTVCFSYLPHSRFILDMTDEQES